MNQVSNPYVLVIKRLRIGNSTLSHHRKQGGAGVCSNCHLGEPETNKHYFLKCPKFSVHRKKLYHSIGENINNMKAGCPRQPLSYPQNCWYTSRFSAGKSVKC